MLSEQELQKVEKNFLDTAKWISGMIFLLGGSGLLGFGIYNWIHYDRYRQEYQELQDTCAIDQTRCRNLTNEALRIRSGESQDSSLSPWKVGILLTPMNHQICKTTVSYSPFHKECDKRLQHRNLAIAFSSAAAVSMGVGIGLLIWTFKKKHKKKTALSSSIQFHPILTQKHTGLAFQLSF